ncbi:PPOX class F420-dependent oxidoreductase [Mycobacterium simiae]|uniref:PPOX class F420-dependent oxidoreductase n=1 Tax=Mycobacterium simiae TaxID=1784 RepID=A0A5B1BH95_MYCSI|nr:PPOX class F420-dependent oxidoreductase [Mycobacterium simiae]KAA1247391.1 PPOX class F420-dependent oxidoreductase [Mycobacterium simiae]
MPVFTDVETAYLASQRLGRLVTLAPKGSPQVRPVRFSYNAELDTIDIGGKAMAGSRKLRNVENDSRVAFVVDDLASIDPWRPRGIEIRGQAEALSIDGGAMVRIHPRRVLVWGLDGESPAVHARNVP